jgi:hypothetical protein
MKTRTLPLIFYALLALTLACDNIEIDYGGRDDCSEGQLVKSEFSLDQAGMANYIADKVEVLDYISLEASQTFTGACNGDSVLVTFSADILKDAPKPVFVGCYIWYEGEITPLPVVWSGTGQYDHYSGTAKAISPDKYDEGNFGVIVEFGFYKEDNFFDAREYLRTVFVSFTATAEYYKMD